jgi:hypothetical protein
MSFFSGYKAGKSSSAAAVHMTHPSRRLICGLQ